jgi:hypothetical protein
LEIKQHAIAHVKEKKKKKYFRKILLLFLIGNLQLSRKVTEYGFKPGLVVEITPNSTPQVLNIQSPNASLNSPFNFYKNGLTNDGSLHSDEHLSPILLQITEESLKDEITIDTIRIDAAACMEPFNLSNYSYVNVRLVSQEVKIL